MYFLFRLIALIFMAMFVLFFGITYCLFSPRNPKHVCTFGKLYGSLYGLFGITLHLRESESSKTVGKAVYIANHQSNWDMVTVSNAIRPRTVSVGKKSLTYIPIFGWLYWLSGNVLIDRNNRTKAMGTIAQIVESIKTKDISVWIFPEGTRSRGRGLLPFKTGAFHAAIDAGVPIVPIVCSTTEHMSVHRGNNGHVIVEVLDPIPTVGLTKENVRELMEKCHKLMKQRIAEIDAEVVKLNEGKIRKFN